MAQGDADEDYYALLNVPKSASAEELKNAYRRLCITYHPDKHSDEAMQKLAKELFPRIQNAYSVLSDPQKRTIYDNYGAAGVSAGSDLAPYYGTTAELKAEFEMKQKREEEEKRMALANAEVRMSCTIDATQVFRPLEAREGLLSLLDDVEIANMSAHQSIDTQLSEQNTLRMGGTLASDNGRGMGSIDATLIHKHSADWSSEVSLGWGTNPSLSLKTEKALWGMHAGAEVTLREYRLGPSVIAIGPTISAVLFRDLSENLFGSLRFTQTLQESRMASSFVRKIGSNSFSTTVQFGTETSRLSLGWRRQLSDNVQMRLSCKVGLGSLGLSYGIDRHLGERDRIAASLSMDTADGVTLKLKYTRMRQTYTLPIWLSDDFLPEAVAVGTLAPVIAYAAIHYLLITPYQARLAEARRLEARRRNRAMTALRRREAMAAVQLMQETVARKVEAEEAAGGLVIEEAWYGELVAAEGTKMDEGAVINVTVPLQCLVRDSQLITSAYSKAGLVGFYDPLPDEPKQLRVRYRFQGRLHQVTIDDKEELRIPRKADLIPEES